MNCSLPIRLLRLWGFFRQEYWSGLLCPPPGDLPDPGIEPMSLMSPALAVGSLPLVPPDLKSGRNCQLGGGYQCLRIISGLMDNPCISLEGPLCRSHWLCRCQANTSPQPWRLSKDSQVTIMQFLPTKILSLLSTTHRRCCGRTQPL